MILRLLSLFYYRITGWEIANTLPDNLKKCVLIAAPHTSYSDFLVGMAALKILRLKINYLAKKELFVFPFKFIFTKTGGIPIDRDLKSNMVEKVIEKFNKNKYFLFAIAPESTRDQVAKWKTGFYHVAMGAGVPICFGYMDYKLKTVGFGEPFFPTGDIDKDMEVIRKFYRNITPKYPWKFNPDGIVAR